MSPCRNQHRFGLSSGGCDGDGEVLPSLVLLIDAFDVISVMYLSVEKRRPRPDTMIKRHPSPIRFRAPKTRSSGFVAACSPSPRPMKLVWWDASVPTRPLAARACHPS